jgi:RNA polymerase sigma-70 factor (ECF subfamily)
VELFAVTSVPSTDATQNDKELVARCQGGEALAFAELVQRHQSRAYNVAFQLLRNHEDAMEVTQDAFVRVHRGLDTFRGECAFTTWLHQIVVNLAHNKHRWWHRRGRELTDSLDEKLATDDGAVDRQVADGGVTPDREAAQAEFLARVDRAMGKLSRKYREVLVLRNVENLSYEEIATVLRCSVGAVKSRISRAREALREELREQG